MCKLNSFDDCFDEDTVSKKKNSKELKNNLNPPKKPHYYINPYPTDNQCNFEGFKKIKFGLKLLEIDIIIPKWIELNCYESEGSSTNKIIILHIINHSYNKSQPKLTIIYSHCSSSDLGQNFPFLIDLSFQLKADIISYDYSGYGHSSGKPKIENIIPNIKIVMNLVKLLNIQNENIILFGREFGTIQSTTVAISNKYLNVKGIILLMPPISKYFTFEKVKEIKCPIFFIHNKNNKSINYDEFNRMFMYSTNQIKWFPEIEDNTLDFIMEYRRKFYSKMKEFLKLVESSHNLFYIKDSPLSNFKTNKLGKDNDKMIPQIVNIGLVEKNNEFSWKTESIFHMENNENIKNLSDL